MTFCSIEYVDEEGEQNIRHAFLTPEQKQILIDEFVERGITAEIHELTSPQVIPSAVLSSDGENPQLGSGS